MSNLTTEAAGDQATKRLEVHPAAAIFPMLDAESFERLKEDIRQHGQRDMVVLLNGHIIDGRNRYRACCELGIEADVCELEECDDPIAYVLSTNLHRRHLRPSQLAMCAARVANLPNGSHGKSSLNLGSYTAERAAEIFSVSTASIEYARKVLRDGCPELIALCEQGESPATAAKFIDACGDKAKQSEVARDGWERVKDQAAAYSGYKSCMTAIKAKCIDKPSADGIKDQCDLELTSEEHPEPSPSALEAAEAERATKARPRVETAEELQAAYSRGRAYLRAIGELPPSDYKCANCGYTEADEDGDCLRCREPAAERPEKTDHTDHLADDQPGDNITPIVEQLNQLLTGIVAVKNDIKVSGGYARTRAKPDRMFGAFDQLALRRKLDNASRAITAVRKKLNEVRRKLK